MKNLKKYFYKCTSVNLLITGLILFLSGIVFFLLTDHIIFQKIKENVTIKPNSTAYEYWLNPPATILRKYYLFDVKNPQQVENGAKPELIQRGPYVYSEKWQKRNVEFIGTEILKYTPVVSLHFEPTLSDGNETDLINFLNIPVAAMIEKNVNSNFENLNPIFLNGIVSMMNKKLFITKTVGELIFGYYESLLDIGKMFNPDKVKNSMFSLTDGKNGTEYQTLSIYTGNKNLLNIGKIFKWNDKEKLDIWNNEFANRINTSDGSIYPPFITKESKLDTFYPDICRSLTLTYLKDNVIDGIKTYDFHLPENVFYNSTLNPNNEGFCTSGKCSANGVFNISNCYGGVSAFISQPHFLNADSEFLDSVIGLKPDKELHDLILHFEPKTGVAISGNIRFQINFYLPSSNRIQLIKNVKPTLLPLLWFDESITLDTSVISKLRLLSVVLPIMTKLPIFVIGFGAILILLSTIFIIKLKFTSKKSNKKESMMDEKELFDHIST